MRLGQELAVRLARTDLEARQLDFVPVEPLAGGTAKRGRDRRARR